MKFAFIRPENQKAGGIYLEKITSKTNTKIKYAAKLVRDSSFRKKEKLFTVEGLRICLDAAESGIEIRDIFFTENEYSKHPGDLEKIFSHTKNIYECSEEIFKKLSDTGTPQGIFCVCAFGENIKPFSTLKDEGKYIALENIQDPSNLGAIARTAEALGIDGAILFDCCDVYNPKVLRGSMGSLFRLPVFKGESMEKFISFAREKGYSIFTTSTDKNSDKITDLPPCDRMICIIGNEGNGVKKSTEELCDRRVTIPMLGRAQSLNASMAACITMWEMLR